MVIFGAGTICAPAYRHHRLHLLYPVCHSGDQFDQKRKNRRNALPGLPFFLLPAYRLRDRHYRRGGEVFLHPEINSLYALPVFLQDMNPWLAGLVTTSLVASIFVSVSTVATAIASLVVKDFFTCRGAIQRRSRSLKPPVGPR